MQLPPSASSSERGDRGAHAGDSGGHTATPAGARQARASPRSSTGTCAASCSPAECGAVMVMKSCLAKASHAWGPWGRGQLARCRGAQRGEGAAPSAPDWRQGRGTLRPHPPPPHHGHGLGAATAPSLIVRAREGRETGPAGNTAAATGGPGVWGSQALWTRTPRAVSGPLPCRRSERSCSLGRPGGSCRLWAATPPTHEGSTSGCVGAAAAAGGAKSRAGPPVSAGAGGGPDSAGRPRWRPGVSPAPGHAQ